MLTLLFSKLLIFCIYRIYIVGHDGYSCLVENDGICFIAAKITK